MVLATNVDMVEPTRWIVSLRNDVFFANGNKMTAEDVLWSFWRINNRTGLTGHLTYLDNDASRAIDDYTIELIFTDYNVSMMGGFAAAVILNKASFVDDATVAMSPMGTGPYKMSDYVVNSHLNLDRRDDYWGDLPGIPYLRFRVLAEEAQRVNALQTGVVDIVSIPFQDVSYVETLPNVTVDLFPWDRTNAIFMNPTLTRDGFSTMDETARLAIAYAIDRQAVIDIVYSGYAIMSQLPLSAGTSDHEKRFEGRGIYGEPDNGYNPTKARELAISSGLVNTELLLVNNGSAVDSLIAELVQSNLADIGVTVNIHTFDMGSWLTVIFDETQWDMAVQFTFGGTMAASYRTWGYNMFAGIREGAPWPGRERFLDLVADITAISDQAELSRRYDEITTILVNACLWYNLCDTVDPRAYHSDLKGYLPLGGGYILYSDLYW